MTLNLMKIKIIAAVLIIRIMFHTIELHLVILM